MDPALRSAPLLRGVAWLLAAFTAAGACSFSFEAGSPPRQASPVPPLETVDTGGDWYTVYFTNPDDPKSRSLRGGPDRFLAEAIHLARASVDVAVQELDLWSVRDALIDAHKRGVSVRMVTESDYLDTEEVQQLIEAGIPVLGDRREGLMHDKFVVIDRSEVWTGSMNYTISEAYRNNNNLIRIRSAELAKDYTTEFAEMFEADQFGPGSPANTPYPALTIEDVSLEVYYSPDDGVEQRLEQLIREAQKDIFFLAFSFTSDKLAQAILDRAAAGVTVAGVMDKSQYKSNIGSDYDTFRSAGLDVRLDGNPRNMHHKVIIIDQSIVIAGSYNFTFSAETRNDENLLVIHSPEIAELFLKEFQKVFLQAR